MEFAILLGVLGRC